MACKNLIYLDNAATSYPKPAGCLHRALDAYLEWGGSPGRGSYDLAVEANRVVSDIREELIGFFGGDDRYRLCFAYNATEALNTLLQGVAESGSHIVSTCLEHNSVLRPLHHLREQGRITFDLVPFGGNGFVDPDEIAAAMRPDTRLVIVNHASNVLGTIQPVADIGKICSDRAVPLFLDVSQSAGVVPIEASKWNVAGLAFTGHKALLAPTGIGGLMINQEIKISATRFGGTGIDSSNPFHTAEYPYRLEAGTLNLFGVLALRETLAYLKTRDQEARYKREMALLAELRDNLMSLDNVQLYAVQSLDNHLPLLCCNIQGRSAEDLAAVLDGDFNIAVRAGLHCAPLAHKGLGTVPDGAVRFSLGVYSQKEHIEAAIQAMSRIAQSP
ncbi:MAG: aminotransferase class V-fold PLP-dependent enzyme [Syntrophorhabdales bacterium]